MITKKMLIEKAKAAKQENCNLWMVIDHNKELNLIIDSSSNSNVFLNKYNYTYDDNLIQAFTPDMIVKYDYANYNGGSVSLELFLSIINEKYT